MRSWVRCGMDLAAGERLITSETEAVDSPRCSASAFKVLRRGAGSVDAELIVVESRLLGIVEAFRHKPAEATMLMECEAGRGPDEVAREVGTESADCDNAANLEWLAGRILKETAAIGVTRTDGCSTGF